LTLLGPSPDMAVVEFRFRRALDEDVLQDRKWTPAGGWHERFETGGVEIDWASGTMLIPWWDRARYIRKSIRPQFRRTAWLNVFSDLVPGATQEISTQETSASQTQPSAEIEQKVRRWYDDRVANWPAGQKPPSADEDEKAAEDELTGVPKLRDFVRQARKDRAPGEWKKPGPRRSRRQTLTDHLAQRDEAEAEAEAKGEPDTTTSPSNSTDC